MTIQTLTLKSFVLAAEDGRKQQPLNILGAESSVKLFFQLIFQLLFQRVFCDRLSASPRAF